MTAQYKTLTTVRQCVALVGGPGPVTEMFGYRHRTAVYNQRDRNRFPPESYVAWQKMLADRGATAPASLWSQFEIAE